MNSRPITTLFMIQSLDGKISTGDNDSLDIDKDLSRIVGIKEGLYQYYDLEKKTDLVSLNSGRVQVKVGVNERKWTRKEHDDVSFIIIDSRPHLDKNGVEYFAKRSKIFYVITTNKNHPAFLLKNKYSNIKILFYEKNIDFVDAFNTLKQKYGIQNITIQTGGTLNAELLKLKLIDRISIVIAPCLIGGRNTQSLIGGESSHTGIDLKHIKSLSLKKCDILKNSYLHLQYDVINETVIG